VGGQWGEGPQEEGPLGEGPQGESSRGEGPLGEDPRVEGPQEEGPLGEDPVLGVLLTRHPFEEEMHTCNVASSHTSTSVTHCHLWCFSCCSLLQKLFATLCNNIIEQVMPLPSRGINASICCW